MQLLYIIINEKQYVLRGKLYILISLIIKEITIILSCIMRELITEPPLHTTHYVL